MADSTTNLEQIVSAQAQKEVTANQLFDAMSPASIFGRHAETCIGLFWGFYGGRWGGELIDNDTIELDPSVVSYIVVDRLSGAVFLAGDSPSDVPSDAPSEWSDTGTYGRLYKVTTGASTVLEYEDHRCGPGGIWTGVVEGGGVSSEGGGGGGGTGDGNLTPDTHPAVPDDADDEFEFGTALDTSGSRFAAATPWTVLNSATHSVADGHLVLLAPAQTTREVRGAYQAVSGSAWKYRAKLTAAIGSEANYFMAGMFVRNSGNSKLYTHMHLWNSAHILEIDRMTDLTTFGSSLASLTTTRAIHSTLYFEIELAAATLHFRYSDSGVEGSFVELANEGVGAFLSAVNQVGLFGNSMNSVDAGGAWDWFRRIS